ncbi:GNAT family N-acetyltransferase [Lachnospiraceae bacterium LCP25S3_G4]
MDTAVYFERANDQDVEDIVRSIHIAKEGISEDGWYVAVDEEFVRDCITQKGFVLKAMVDCVMAGFLIVYFPLFDPDNLGQYQHFSEEEQSKVAHMDTICVLPQYRGLRIQKNLLLQAEPVIQSMGYRYSMATAHPDNIYSCRNLVSTGYKVIGQDHMYDGLLRNIYYKEV